MVAPALMRAGATMPAASRVVMWLDFG